MKAYGKKMIGLMLTAVFCLSPVSAFAAETEAEPSLTITSGLELESEETECTFDDSRVIYGEAAPETEITFTISQMDKYGELQEVYSDHFTVSSLGLFSAAFPLEMGYNYITMTMERNDLEEKIIETVVKRVPQDVKTQLQQMIALPGLNGTF